MRSVRLESGLGGFLLVESTSFTGKEKIDMKKLLIIVFYITIASLMLSACSKTNNNTTVSSSSTNNSTNLSSSTSSSVTSGQSNKIEISGFAFTPEIIKIKAGETVVWENLDSAAHTVVFPTFSSTSINKGETYSKVFTDKGTFNYSCGIHPSMKGQIIVE